MVAETIKRRYVSLDALLDEALAEEAARDAHRKSNLRRRPVDNRQSNPYFPEGGVGVSPGPASVAAVQQQQQVQQPEQVQQRRQTAEEQAKAGQQAEELIAAAQTATPSRHALDFPQWGGGLAPQTTRPAATLWADRPRRGKGGELLQRATTIGNAYGIREDADGRKRLAYKNPSALYWQDWHIWLIVAAYRWLNTAYRAGKFSSTEDSHIGADGPSREELHAAFALIMHRHGERVDHYEVGMKNMSPRGFDDEDEVERLAASAAGYVYDTWDADYIAQRVEWGRKGGKASSRGPVAYEAFLNLPRGLTQQQQADALGVNVRTIRSYEERQRVARA